MRIIRSVGTLALPVLLMIGFCGCTLDKNHNSNPDSSDQPLPGDLDDDQFESASLALSMSQDYTNSMMAELYSGIGRIDSLSGSPALAPGPGSVFAASEADSIVINYDALTGYWHLTIEVEDLNQGAVFSYADSIQFRNSLGVLQWPDASVNEIRAGLALSGQAIDNAPNAPNRMVVEFTEEIIVTGAIMTEGLVSTSGVGSFYADIYAADDSSSCDFTFSMSAELRGIVQDLGLLEISPCPQGGTLVSTGSLAWLCTGDGFSLDISGAWESTATYHGESVIMIAESAGTRWEYSGLCSDL